MKRWSVWSAVVVSAVLAAPVIHADVKTRQKTLVTFEGLLGVGMRMFGGAAARDGITSTVAVKGGRQASMNDLTGTIIDLTEENIYTLDIKKKEYRVSTFAEARALYEKARADAEKQMQSMKPEERQQFQDATKQLEYTASVKETGQRKTLAGYDTREVVVTVIGHERAKTVEESGGVVLTNTLWIGPKIAALDELYEFQMRYVKAVYGDAVGGELPQMASMSAMYPAFKSMAEQLATEGRRLQGTALSTTMIFESVRSAEQMKALAEQAPPPTSGGIGGLLAKKMMGDRATPQQRTKIMTTAHDILSVETAVGAADLAVPAVFKLKK